MDRWLTGFVLGTLSLLFLPQAAPVALSGVTLLALLSLACVFHYSCHRAKLALLLSGIFVGLIWAMIQVDEHQTSRVAMASWQAEQTANQTRLVRVMSIPEMSETSFGWRWRFVAQLEDSSDHLSGNVLITWYFSSETMPSRSPQLGDHWRLQLKLKPAQGLRNQGSFLIHRLWLRQGIVALANVAGGEYIATNISPREKWLTQTRTLLDSHHFGALLLALVFGERADLSQEEWEVWQRTGLAHMLAISGLHLTLVCGFVLVLLRATLLRKALAPFGLRRWQVRQGLLFILVVLAGLGYAWLADFAVATLRAWMMLTVIGWHQVFGERTQAWRVLLRTVAAVVVVEPYAYLQPGFWLSLGAVSSIYCYRWRWSFRGTSWWRLVVFEAFLLWALLPLSVFIFNGYSVVAILTNVAVIPLLTFWILPLSLLGLLAQLSLSFESAQWLWDLASWPLIQIWPVLRWLASQTWSWWEGSLAQWSAWVALLGMVMPLPLHWHVRRWLGYVVIIGVFIGALWLRPNQHELRLHMLDVGHGSAIVLERNGYALLIDSAMQFAEAKPLAMSTLVPFLEYHHLQPEFGFITHQDSDHSGGQASLSERYPTLQWRGASTVHGCVAGQQGVWRQVHWRVLHPQVHSDVPRNNDSCVLQLRFGHLKILATGDIERKGEATLVGRQYHQLPADILVVPHHGSATSSTEVFLNRVGPQVALLSRGRFNRYGLPANAVRDRYQRLDIPWFDTATDGQISLRTDGKHWRILTPLSGKLGSWFDAHN